jgi:hypothetical protein
MWRAPALQPGAVYDDGGLLLRPTFGHLQLYFAETSFQHDKWRTDRRPTSEAAVYFNRGHGLNGLIQKVVRGTHGQYQKE